VNGNGTIGAVALYLLFAWLISAAGAAWLTERKGYGERAGLMLGLLLTVAGLVAALLLPSRPASKWRSQGWLPRRRPPARGAGEWPPPGVSP
jgi:fucose permease